MRKGIATKQVTKTLTDLKHLLQSYALARPVIRLSLRVIGAKSEKSNFIYAPRPGAGPEDAVLKVVGRDVSSQCSWSIWEQNGYELRTCLPRIDAEPTKISGTGVFISIDGRPVSSTKGIARKITKLFREHLSAADRHPESISNPFVRMDISCPCESYDANIEPSKDDVLFNDSQAILSVVESLLRNTYPVIATELKNAHSDHEPMATAAPMTSSTLAAEADIANRSSVTAISQQSELCSSPPATVSTISHFCTNMYRVDVDDSDIQGQNSLPTALTEPENEQELRKNVTLSNPWTIAKMNAPIRPRQSTTMQLQEPSPPPSDPLINENMSDRITTSPLRACREPQSLSTVRTHIAAETSSPLALRDLDHTNPTGRRGREQQSAPSAPDRNSDNNPILASANARYDLAQRAESALPSFRRVPGVHVLSKVVPYDNALRPHRQQRYQTRQYMRHGQSSPGTKQCDTMSDRPQILARSPATVQGGPASSTEIRELFERPLRPHSGFYKVLPKTTATASSIQRSDNPQENHTDLVDGYIGARNIEDQAENTKLQNCTTTVLAGRVHRTRSSGLPLEQTPADKQMHDMVLRTSLPGEALDSLMRTFLPERKGDAHFLANVRDEELAAWTKRLELLLKEFKLGNETIADAINHLPGIVKSTVNPD